jgi:hypothetical protein
MDEGFGKVIQATQTYENFLQFHFALKNNNNSQQVSSATKATDNKHNKHF